jgi:hypothetical protein
MGDVLLKCKYQSIIFSEDAAEQSAALKAQLERQCVRAFLTHIFSHTHSPQG